MRTAGGTGSAQGVATGHASATTANGQLAIANTTAVGKGGATDSTSLTRGGGVVTSVSAFASTQVGATGANTTGSEAELGAVVGFGGSSYSSYAFATEVPSASFVSSTSLRQRQSQRGALGGGTVSRRGVGGRLRSPPRRLGRATTRARSLGPSTRRRFRGT